MRAVFFWLGTVVGWLSLALVVLSFGGVGYVVLMAPDCPPGPAHHCGEGVGIVVAAGLWLGVVAVITSAVGFAVRAFAEPKRPAA